MLRVGAAAWGFDGLEGSLNMFSFFPEVSVALPDLVDLQKRDIDSTDPSSLQVSPRYRQGVGTGPGRSASPASVHVGDLCLGPVAEDRATVPKQAE